MCVYNMLYIWIYMLYMISPFNIHTKGGGNQTQLFSQKPSIIYLINAVAFFPSPDFLSAAKIMPILLTIFQGTGLSFTVNTCEYVYLIVLYLGLQ